MGTSVVREHLFRFLVMCRSPCSECSGCDNTIHAPTQRVGDADCRMLCEASHAEYCGNQNRVAIYQFSASGVAPGPKTCLETDLGNFTLRAQFRNPPTTGPATVSLKVVVVEMVKNVLWTILSVSYLCPLNIICHLFFLPGMPDVLLRVALTKFVKLDRESTLNRLPRATDGVDIHQRWRVPELRCIYSCFPRIPDLLHDGEFPNNIATRLEKYPEMHADGQRRPHRKPSAACVQW